MVGTYLRFFTFLDLEEILSLDRATIERPHERAAQRALAASVVALVHGDAEVAAAQEASAALFGGRVATLDESTLLDVVEEVPSSSIAADRIAGGVLLVDLLAECGLVTSKGEARRTIEQHGAFVNDVARAGLDAQVTSEDLLHGRYLVLRRGKRTYHLVTVS